MFIHSDFSISKPSNPWCNLLISFFLIIFYIFLCVSYVVPSYLYQLYILLVDRKVNSIYCIYLGPI